MTLQQFYNAYAAWLDAGAPDDQPFTRHTGLCYNLYKFGGNNDVRKEMTRQFEEAGLDSHYPFNDGDVDDYEIRVDDLTQHLNLKRIQWVKDHAQ